MSYLGELCPPPRSSTDRLHLKIRLDYPLRTRNIPTTDNLHALEGIPMAVIRKINFDNLSAADKKELRRLLQQQKKSLQDALKATNKELADLGRSKNVKKGKKAKTAKK